MKTTRLLRLRKEVLAQLADGELGRLAGGGQPDMLPASAPTLCHTCLTCYWTCWCIQ